ncbi:hypothetical protein QBC46DRAFT_74042 [Diplogelasinospora grovesii]|uniref:Carbohydrate-binding module family 50 protein n=1 Tax=Diplogelasinospora grovesii TaxID=303347 RepID=A0AAN6S6K1_9PEZI|nr:hypothetical protein QBC46DRAFT_74042 [Diplogelasinospora grovesii]
MGRWSHLDSDADRLPEGMTRVGYDADTQVYTYRDDADGSLWEGAPGSVYGRLTRVSSGPSSPAVPRLPSVYIDDDIEGEEQPYVLHEYDPDGGSSNRCRESIEVVQLTKPRKVRLSSLPHSPSHSGRSRKLPELPGSVRKPGRRNKPAVEKPRRVDENGVSEDEDDMSGKGGDSGTDVGFEDAEEKTGARVREDPLERVRSGRGEIRQQQAQTKTHAQPLKRAGTLSRIARYLSGGRMAEAGSAEAEERGDGVPVGEGRRRAATERPAENPRDTGTERDRRRLSRASTLVAGTHGTTTGIASPRPRRATTFDEILDGHCSN